ncbi:MAG TPA: glycosyltransferase [Bryobacteraceae bacterium]|jgi:GT2 family glycosyltransferase|nr:glycosyltransferase [Bryobacteraceae bacterium]
MKLLRGIGIIFLSLCSPFFLAVAGIALALSDLAFLIFGKRLPISNGAARKPGGASVVIPNWNGRDLLEKFLPSVVKALETNPENEIIVVDNASTDGSVEFLREYFPAVRVLALAENLGFGGGSNAGFREARNDVVVLLNNDMRVEADFLPRLLEPFEDPLVFSVSCQIFFSDPNKIREETGLTETWWQSGRLRVRHRIDPEVDRAFPCAYPGGGSSAFDRRKFLELGGFDDLFHPFYFEDTDLGMQAWKRGWKVLYEPRSIVYHEHRGTIGRKFSPQHVHGVVKKNLVLYTWKNIHDWRMLATHFPECAVMALFSPLARRAEARALPLGVSKAFLELWQAVKARWRAKQLAVLPQRETFLRQKGGYFRDRFEAASADANERLQIVFLSPYPIEPPTHGGAVFMKETLTALRSLADVHLVSFLDNSMQLPQQAPLKTICASTSFVVRKHSTPYDLSDPRPRVIREFADAEFDWALHRALYLRRAHVLQIEYTMLAQYAGDYRHIPCFLFEHDISFQSLGRRIATSGFRPPALVAYLQLLRYELRSLRRFARIQVCSRENGQYLLQFLPELAGRIDSDLRAVIDAGRYPFTVTGRVPDTLLFAGSFNHLPNVQGLVWFIEQVFPVVLARRPGVRLIIAGSGNIKRLGARANHPNIEVKGFVPEIQDLLNAAAVLVCPVLSGSGVRVKLLEAFAAGIPVVSTRLGAEGLCTSSGYPCEVADEPKQFAAAVIKLLEDPSGAAQLALQARQFVEGERNVHAATAKLEATYRHELLRRVKPAASF